jgi:magnesium transporter
MNSYLIEKKIGEFTWIDICNPNKDEIIALAEKYNLDILEVKDSLQVGHLPKHEIQDTYKFLIIRAYTAENSMRITNIQELSNKISFFYNDKKIITVHTKEFEMLKKIDVNRINNVDQFLIYIIKKMIETYEEPAEFLNQKIDVFEKTIFLKDYHEVSLETLYFIKSQTRVTKKLLQFTQNVLHKLEVHKGSRTGLQDIQDKLLNLILKYEEVLESSNNLLHTYLSINDQKNNDVMKLLTVFSAFFLPLTFIVGLYGMNFQYMPELKMKYGYLFVIIVMVIISIIIYYWFKRKKIM